MDGINDLSHKRVAVYARVSTKSLDQTSSIENQTRYYRDKIAKNPNWELVKIYKDEGKSGTSKKGRKDFQQMLDDAYNQKFDLSSATDCWDNPISAEQGCIYLERDINSRLKRYAEDESITDICIWYECIGTGSYLIYIGYA